MELLRGKTLMWKNNWRYDFPSIAERSFFLLPTELYLFVVRRVCLDGTALERTQRKKSVLTNGMSFALSLETCCVHTFRRQLVRKQAGGQAGEEIGGHSQQHSKSKSQLNLWLLLSRSKTLVRLSRPNISLFSECQNKSTVVSYRHKHWRSTDFVPLKS